MGEFSTLESVCAEFVDCVNRTAPESYGGEYYAVGTPAMRGNVINLTEARRLSAETFERWTRRLRPIEGDLLIAREAPVGPVVRIPAGDCYAAGQRTTHLRADSAAIDPRYLYYLLISPNVQARLLAQAMGSTVPHLRVADLRTFELPVLPEMSQQSAIAEVLGALDDKIVANERIVVGLDDLVRARYQSLGGYDEMTVGDIATNIRVQVQPSTVTSDVDYVGLEHLPRRRMWASTGGTADDVMSAKSGFAPGDVLFGKLRPYFHKVVHVGRGGICSTDILVVRANEPSLGGFALAACASDETVKACTASVEGTRMPRTRWSDLAAVAIRWPGLLEAREFSAWVSEQSMLAHALYEECAHLARTRDELLPLLMSGKLRVKDAEAVAAEVL